MDTFSKSPSRGRRSAQALLHTFPLTGTSEGTVPCETLVLMVEMPVKLCFWRDRVYWHISDASIKLPNRGSDSVGGTLGMSFFF